MSVKKCANLVNSLINIYCDGSFDPKLGSGSYGSITCLVDGVSEKFSGKFPEIKGARAAEELAILHGILNAGYYLRTCKVVVFSDDKNLVDLINKVLDKGVSESLDINNSASSYAYKIIILLAHSFDIKFMWQNADTSVHIKMCHNLAKAVRC